MEQRYIQWGNNVVVGHGAVSGGVDWKQEKLKSSGTTSTDVYKRDTTGLYLTGQQQIDSVTLEASAVLLPEGGGEESCAVRERCPITVDKFPACGRLPGTVPAKLLVMILTAGSFQRHAVNLLLSRQIKTSLSDGTAAD